MREGSVFVWLVKSTDWLTALLIVASPMALLVARLRRTRGARLAFVASTAGALVGPAVVIAQRLGHPMEFVIWWCSVVSMLSSVCVGGIRWSYGTSDSEPSELSIPSASVSARPFLTTGIVVSLVTGGAAAALLLFSLSTRLLGLVVELATAEPWNGHRLYGFGTSGLWSLGALIVACVVSMVSRRERRLAVCTLSLVAMAALWVGVLGPVFDVLKTGGLRHTGRLLVLLSALSGVVVLAAWAVGRLEWRRRWRLALQNPDALMEVAPPLPGFRPVLRIVAVLVLWLVGYHLAVPVPWAWGGERAPVVIAGAAAVVGGCGCLLWIAQSWDTGLADAALGLFSLSFAAVAVAVAPSHQAVMAERYPVVFNAMMVGFTVAAALWTWLFAFWQQQLDEGSAWTTAGRLIPHVRRFAFLNILLALLLGAVMALWPRLRSIGTPDFSVGRVTAGFGGNLFLLLISLWSARVMKRLLFRLLTILALLSTVGFMVMRMLPFTPRFG